ncbi:unnamed protein product [Pleuronectes platessa]|uniref:Uncharacterized protein n=1 Tax=Pleuronectes platessa TaxID=8262 RepID=A0A9N7UZT5_PLEPL|nr:unnamed protein product [Pleuronectes platessa]
MRSAWPSKDSLEFFPEWGSIPPLSQKAQEDPHGSRSLRLNPDIPLAESQQNPKAPTGRGQAPLRRTKFIPSKEKDEFSPFRPSAESRCHQQNQQSTALEATNNLLVSRNSADRA